METFKWVKGFEGKYEVSDLGRVRSHAGKLPKILKCAPDKRGYIPVVLHGDKLKRYWMHRLVAETFIPNVKNRAEVNHKNGNKSDCRAENLEWVSRSQNIRHAYESGLMPTTWKPGSRNHNSSLSDDDVKKMRNLYDDREISQLELAKMFNVTKGTVHRILNRKSWTHI